MISRTTDIFKNTIFLYIRMFMTIVVGFYTTRVVVDVLGVSDYGVYVLIGGLVVLFNFLNDSLIGTVKRFVSVGIGRDDADYTRKVFNVGVVTNGVVALLIVVLLETIVYWFFLNKLNIPEESVYAAKVVFHLSTLRVLIGILQVPYSSLVIAYERMDFFALTSIVDTLAKLVIVLFLLFFDSNKLILYAILLFAISVPMLIWHIVYCKRHFGGTTKFCWVRSRSLYEEILSFSLWSMVGGVSTVASKQGTNIILNLFGGVVVNASMGIVNMASSIVSQFSSSIQTAFGPPMTKSYAAREYNHMRGLLDRSCRCSVYMILITAVPVAFNLNYLLHIWLGDNVPPLTEYFMIITFLSILIESWSTPLYQVISATGKISKYQLYGNIYLLLALPIGYIVLSNGAAISAMLWCGVFSVVLVFLYRIYYIYTLKLIDWRYIWRGLLLPTSRVIGISLVFSYLLYIVWQAETLPMVIIWCVTDVAVLALVIYTMGLTLEERQFVKSAIKRKLCR